MTWIVTPHPPDAKICDVIKNALAAREYIVEKCQVKLTSAYLMIQEGAGGRFLAATCELRYSPVTDEKRLLMFNFQTEDENPSLIKFPRQWLPWLGKTRTKKSAVWRSRVSVG